MRFISTKMHGYLDYIVGALLIAAPWILGFNDHETATYLPMFLGAAAIVYSLLTNYELGAWPSLSMRTHLTLDLLSGVLLAVSPWLFGFSEYVWAPHLIFGLLEIGAALMTQRTPSGERGMRPSGQHRAASH
jgi:hypothetical protein